MGATFCLPSTLRDFLPYFFLVLLLLGGQPTNGDQFSNRRFFFYIPEYLCHSPNFLSHSPWPHQRAYISLYAGSHLFFSLSRCIKFLPVFGYFLKC